MLRVSGSANFGFNQSIVFGDIQFIAQTPAYHTMTRRDGGIGIYLGGTLDQGNYYDNNSHHWRMATGFGSEKMLLTATDFIVSGVNTYRFGTDAGLGGQFQIGGGTNLAIDFSASGRIDQKYYDTAAAVDAKRWEISVDGVAGPNSFAILMRSDGGTAGPQVFRAFRSANTFNSLDFAQLVQLTSIAFSPVTTGAITLGNSSQRWGKLWGQDADFTSNVVVSGTFSASSGFFTVNSTGQVSIKGSLAELALSPRSGGGANWELYSPTTASFRLFHTSDQYIFSDAEFTPSATGGKTLGITGVRWGKYWGADADFTGDIKIGTNLGTFDSSSTAVNDYVLSYNGTKWAARNLQLTFASGDVATGIVPTGSVAGSAASYVGGAITAVKGGPATPATPVLTPEYKALLITLDSAAPAGTVWSVEAGLNPALSDATIIAETISQKIVHSRLTLGTTYYYRYRNHGTDGFGAYSAIGNGVPSSTAETNVFGLILASQLAVGNLSSINIDVGTLSAGKIQNSSNTVGLLIGAGAVPATWTQGIIFSGTNLSVGSNLIRYIDFGATGTNKIIKFDNAFSLDAQGNAVFSGTLQAGKITNAVNTAGIRVDAGTALPGTWTTYLDLGATGSASLLHHPGLDLTADGRAIFSGVARVGSLQARNDINITTDYFSVAGQGLGQGYRFLFQNGNNLNSIVFSGTYVGIGFAATAAGVGSAPSTANRIEINGQLWNTLVDRGDESGNFTINWNSGNVQRVRLTGTPPQTVTLSNGLTGGVYTLMVYQNSAGSKTITWATSDADTNVEWEASTPPVLTTTANKVDIITFVKTTGISATRHYYGTVSGKNFTG